MRIILALLIICQPARSDDFRWSVTDSPKFSWAITDSHPVGPEKPGVLPLPDSGVESPPKTVHPESPISVREFVHEIDVWHGHEADSGSAVHVGGGKFLTCWHVFTDGNGNPWQVSRIVIDGRQYGATWTQVPGRDVTVVQLAGFDGPGSLVNPDRLLPGQPLLVCGKKTGLHSGTLVAHQGGAPTVNCEEPNTVNGDSGAGVFNASGELVGVHWGSIGNEVFFTPLSEVRDLFAPSASAGIGGHIPSASPGADLSEFPSPCVLKFTAPWCGTCQTEGVSGWLKNSNWRVEPVDFDSHRELAGQLGITALPTFVVIRGHREVGRYTGASVNGFLPVIKGATAQPVTAVDDAAQAPTPHAEVRRILAILQPRQNEVFCDYGCGDGRFCIAAAQTYGCRAVGIEIDPDKAAEARRNVAAAGLSDRVEIITGDALETDVKADVGVAYLYPGTLIDLRPKIDALDRFASRLHPLPWKSGTNNGGVYVYQKQQMREVPYALYGGWKYYGDCCGDSGCGMRAEILRQLSAREHVELVPVR